MSHPTARRPEELAAAGGTAAVVGAAMLAKPSFLPTHSGGGSSAPTAPKPQSASSDATTSSPDGTASEVPIADAEAPAPTDGSTAPADAATDGGQPDGAQPDASQPDGEGELDTAAGNRSERTLEEIDQALTAINPNFDWSDPDNGYATNCGHTSSNLNDFLNGQAVSEAPGGTTLDTPQMEARTGNPQTPMTPEQIEATLRAIGPGSHCVVGVDRSTGFGHWFNAYFDGDQVWVLDAQPGGTRSPWPPHEPLATIWDASISPEHVVDPATPEASAPGVNAPAFVPTTPAVTSTTPDAATTTPDASTTTPDAATTTPDAAMTPDAATTTPDAAMTPDASSTPVDGTATSPADGSPSTPTGPGATPKQGQVGEAAPGRGETARTSPDGGTPWDESMGDPVLSGADHGPGWNRVEDRVASNPIDPNYGDLRPPGEFSALGDQFAHPGTVPDAIADLIADPDAPYGRDTDGRPFNRPEWEARYTDDNGRPVYPGNDGGSQGSFVEFNDLDAFMAHYGDQVDRMGRPAAISSRSRERPSSSVRCRRATFGTPTRSTRSAAARSSWCAHRGVGDRSGIRPSGRRIAGSHPRCRGGGRCRSTT